MRVLLFLIFLLNFSIHAMDQIAITISDAYEQVLQEKVANQMRFVQQKDALIEQAESNINKSWMALSGVAVWVAKIACINPRMTITMTDAYAFGCCCSLFGAFCIAGCCNCCKAMMLKEE